jgi:hypothetical protein
VRPELRVADDLRADRELAAHREASTSERPPRRGRGVEGRSPSPRAPRRRSAGKRARVESACASVPTGTQAGSSEPPVAVAARIRRR